MKCPALLLAFALGLAASPLAAQHPDDEDAMPAPGAQVGMVADYDAPLGTVAFQYRALIGPADATARASTTQTIKLGFETREFRSLYTAFESTAKLEYSEGGKVKIVNYSGRPWTNPAKRMLLTNIGGQYRRDDGAGSKPLLSDDLALLKKRDESVYCWLPALLGQDYLCRRPLGWVLERQLGLFNLVRHPLLEGKNRYFTGKLDESRAREALTDGGYDDAQIATLLARLAWVRIEVDVNSGKLIRYSIFGEISKQPYTLEFEFK